MDAHKLGIEIALENDAALAAARQFRDAQRANLRQLLADADATEKAITGATQREVQARVRDERGRFTARKKDAEEAAEAEAKGWASTRSAASSASQAVAGFAVQMLGLNSATAIVGTIVDGFKAAQKSAYDAGKMVGDYRQALLELAALKGRLGDTTGALGEEVAFRAKTLQTAEGARQFQEAALGVGQASIDAPGRPGLIAPEEFTRAMELAGSFQAAEGGSAEAQGRLIGQVPALLGRRTTGEEAFRREQQLYNIFQPGGATFSSLSSQYLKNAPLVTSGVYGKPERGMSEMAALLSAFSVTNPEGAGENVQQFTRATVAALGRMRGVQVMGESEKQAEYLKRLGATDQMSPIEIGKRIAGDLAKQETGAAGRGERFNAYSYLQHKGYGSIEDINALLGFSGLMKTGQFEGTFEPLAGKVPTAAEAIAPVERAQRTEPALQRRRSELAGEASKIAVGAGREEYWQNLFRMGFERLKARGTVAGEAADFQNAWDIDPREIIFGTRRKTEMEAQRTIVEEANRVGVPGSEIPALTERGPHGTSTPRFVGREALYELSRKITARGGNPLPGLEDVTEAAERQLGEAKRFEEGRPLPGAMHPVSAVEGGPAPGVAGRAAVPPGGAGGRPGQADVMTEKTGREMVEHLKGLREDVKPRGPEPAPRVPLGAPAAPRR